MTTWTAEADARLRDYLDKHELSAGLGWMWEAITVVQPAADAAGYGDEWRAMCEQRKNYAAAYAAAAAAAAWQQFDPAGFLAALLTKSDAR